MAISLSYTTPWSVHTRSAHAAEYPGAASTAATSAASAEQKSRSACCAGTPDVLDGRLRAAPFQEETADAAGDQEG